MIKIDGKTAVSISAMGENHAYQYALVVRPDTMEVLGQDCYYYDECGHAAVSYTHLDVYKRQEEQ